MSVTVEDALEVVGGGTDGLPLDRRAVFPVGKAVGGGDKAGVQVNIRAQLDGLAGKIVGLGLFGKAVQIADVLQDVRIALRSRRFIHPAKVDHLILVRQTGSDGGKGLQDRRTRFVCLRRSFIVHYDRPIPIEVKNRPLISVVALDGIDGDLFDRTGLIAGRTAGNALAALRCGIYTRHLDGAVRPTVDRAEADVSVRRLLANLHFAHVETLLQYNVYVLPNMTDDTA